MGFRIAPLSSGPIPKDRAKRQQQPRRLHEKGYLQYLHQLPCVVSGVTNDVIAHHLRMGRFRMGVKEDDSLAIPLTNYMHDELHKGSEYAFWNRWGFEPFDLCRDLYAVFLQCGPSVPAGNAIIYAHRALAQQRAACSLKLFDVKEAA